MKYTIRWGFYNDYENSEEFDSTEPELQDENIEDIVVCHLNDLMNLEDPDWCNVYKDGELVNSYDKMEECEYEEFHDGWY